MQLCTGGTEQPQGGRQAGGRGRDVPSAAPHYNLLSLNSFSTPPTFHIFLVIRQQSTMSCVAWAPRSPRFRHCPLPPVDMLMLFGPYWVNLGFTLPFPLQDSIKRNTQQGGAQKLTHIFPYWQLPTDFCKGESGFEDRICCTQEWRDPDK